MSIAQGTTYYDYPQVQLTDRPTFADFNPAFSDIDAKLYGLITGAATDEQAIADLGLAVGGLRTDLGSVNDTATAAKNKADANEEAIGLLGTQVSQNTTKLGTKIDSNAIAEPYDTAATYGVGDIVTYSGQRYRCITAVAVAEPFDATKWTGEDVETVLESHASDIAQLDSDLHRGSVYVTANGVKTLKQLLDELYPLVDLSKVESSSKLIVGYSSGSLVFHLMKIQGTDLFYLNDMSTSRFDIANYKLAGSSGSGTYTVTGTSPTFGNNDSYVWASGTRIELFY